MLKIAKILLPFLLIGTGLIASIPILTSCSKPNPTPTPAPVVDGYAQLTFSEASELKPYTVTNPTDFNKLCDSGGSDTEITMGNDEKSITFIKSQLIGLTFGREFDIVTIGNYFLFNCINLNSTLTFPKTLTSIGNSFLANCEKFNSNLFLPNTLTSIDYDFFCGCNDMTSTIFTGSLDVSVFYYNGWSYDTDSFCTGNDLAPCYETGITINGDHKTDILQGFPDRDSGLYRHCNINIA
jgi:hypothetical protein